MRARRTREVLAGLKGPAGASQSLGRPLDLEDLLSEAKSKT
jgi:hypothetical protein